MPFRTVDIKPDLEYLVQLRREFHRYPERSGQEVRTAGRVYEELQKAGITDIRRNIAGHGLVAVIGNGGGPIVALRADMDALPIKEQTDVPFLSENDGVMHACGHDAHIAMLLGAAKIIKQMEHELSGQVVLIFQPAEENAPIGGARPMLEAGALDDPKPDAVFGLHVWPGLPVGQLGIKAGYFMGASDRFTIRVQGKGGHASMPHETIDAALVAVQIAQVLQTIVSRNLNPMDAGVVTIGKIEAGNRYNVIADEAIMEGTVRSLRPEVRNLLERRFTEIVEHVAQSMGAQAEITYQRGYPVLQNDPAAVEVVRSAASCLLGENALPEIEAALVAEDFAVYLEHFPGAFFWLGCGFHDESKNYPLHHPKFLVDERVLPLGAQMLAETALQYIWQKGR
ncbi:M20 metallopeptidase family protein [Brevibacillus sp. H7]|uniref:M20 metallopeptidase family protein n=1 Tax=Brevibacillus sp. H7 TaxID=3349138 RepID=UPI003810899B